MRVASETFRADALGGCRHWIVITTVLVDALKSVIVIVAVQLARLSNWESKKLPLAGKAA